MYCIYCSNIISWRKVPTHELQLLYSRCQRGEKNNCSSLHWGLMSLLLQIRKDDSHGGRFSSLTFRLKLGVNLVASTSKACHLFRYSSHTGASVSWIEISSGYSSLFPAILVITRTHPPLAGVAELLSTSLYQRRRRCYQGLWSISFIPINMHRRWPREWKRSIQLVLQQNKSGRSFFLPVVPYLNLIRNPEPGKILFVALESEIQH